MYENIDDIFEDWGADQLKNALDKQQTYTQQEIISNAYHAIQKKNVFAKEAEPYIKQELSEHLPAWLKQHADEQPDGTYKITSAPQRRQ